MIIEFIIPSYNDPRIVNAIQSIKEFDKSGRHTVISVYDSCSPEGVQSLIKNSLRDGDRLIVEKDKGVFDALNKGLDNANYEYIGWMGTDDYILPGVIVEDVLREINEKGKPDILSYTTLMIKNGVYTRYFKPKPINFQKFGFHNPHYSTFLKTDIIKTSGLRFDIDNHPVSDILFFQELINVNGITYEGNDKAVVVMEEGGVSNQSNVEILRNNIKVYKSLLGIYGRVHSFLFVVSKVTSKLMSKFKVSKYTRNSGVIDEA